MSPLSQELTVIHRLLRIIVILQGPGPWGRQGLAESLGTNVRSVSRDIKRLQAGGVPVEYDTNDQTYRLRHGFYMPPIAFTVPEAVAISVLTGGPAATGHFLSGPAAQAAEKIRAGLPELLREELGSVLPTITLDPARSEAADVADDVWFKVSRAIADRRSLACHYEANTSVPDAEPAEPPEPSESAAFRLDPYALYFGQRGWYVVGQRDDRDGPRNLKLSRFSGVRRLDRVYAIPDDFSLQAHLGRAWRMVRGDGRLHDIRLHFHPPFAATVAETQWHPSQSIEEHDDGAVTVRFRIEGLDEIVWWVLGYGPGCVVEAPQELRDRVAELAKATARRYEE